jgi:hypothetical protein
MFNKMKHIKHIIRIIAIVVLAIMGNSCSNYLDIDDPSTVSTDYFNTKAGQEKLIVNLYARYRSVFTTYALQYFGTDMYLATDESPESAQFNGYNNDLSGLSSNIDSYWSTLYKIVQESNILLNRCTEDVAGSDYKTYVAQATFMRAMAYYYLVETFGGVPLLTEENTSVDNTITEVTKASEADIYKFIISELEKVDGYLPDVATGAGYLSNTALRFFLGKMYLTRAYRSYADAKDLSNAISMFESVIGSSHYKLQTRFADVFSEDNQNNNEIIWAIQYGSDKNFNGSGNPIASQFGFNITALYPGLFTLNQKEYSSMQRYIWTNPIVHEWFRHPDADSRYTATFRFEFDINDPSNANYGKVGIYMPKWNDVSGDTHSAKFFYPFKNASGDYNWYPALAMMNWGTDCMPMCQKFKETKIEWGGKGTREDVIFRMADAYLLCAEAYLLNNQSDKAVEKVNAILKRAAGTDENYEVMKLDASELTLDRLLEERGCEMFGEHDRWFDLKRTGKLLTRARLNPLVVHYNTISEKNLVRPIPYSERIKLKGLDQNEGYNN